MIWHNIIAIFSHVLSDDADFLDKFSCAYPNVPIILPSIDVDSSFKGIPNIRSFRETTP